jgi:micrococcal nuclease
MKKALVLFFCIVSTAAQTRPVDKGTVVVVYDGDTVKVRFDNGSEQRARLIGIDSPEIADSAGGARFEALLSKRFTFHHLFRKRVELGYDREREDKYGRLLVYVWIEGRLFNEFILEEGFARVFLKFPFSMKDRFIRAQEKALEKGRGFWQKKPYPHISAKDAGYYVGTLTRVSFVCARMRKTENFQYLYPKDGNFAALIPAEFLPRFSDIQKIEGKSVEVSGFLEEYRGQPQIMLFFPSQLKLITQKRGPKKGTKKGDGSIFSSLNELHLNFFEK